MSVSKGKKINKNSVRDKAIQGISEYFDLDLHVVKGLSKQEFIYLQQKAKLGMAFEREMGIQERSGERHTLKVLTLISKDRKELKKLIKKSLPQYYRK